MRPSATYTPYTTSSKKKSVDIITFAQFEDGNLLSENREDVESDDKICDKPDDNSIIPPLLSLEELSAWDYGNESDD